MTDRSRGGPQRIPRPDGARPGTPAPWAHLLPAERRVDLERLRARLAARGSGEVVGSHADDAHELSAVLIALYRTDDGPYVILTRRAAHMRSHTHEVAFPGGRSEPGDRHPLDTAIREAEEEIGLDPDLVHPVGLLDRFVTVGSQTLVHPVVAILRRAPELTPEPEEVEHILRVPLAELLLDDVYREERWPMPGPGGATVDRAVTFFELVGDTVWGATAAMLRQLLAVATGTDDRIVRP